MFPFIPKEKKKEKFIQEQLQIEENELPLAEEKDKKDSERGVIIIELF